MAENKIYSYRFKKAGERVLFNALVAGITKFVRWALGANSASPINFAREPLDLTIVHSTNDSKLIAEIFKAVGDHFRNDINAIWHRGNFFLLLNSALLALYASSGFDRSNIWLVGILCAAGLATSYAWYEILSVTISWINVWRVALVDTERAIVKFGPFERGENISGNSEHEMWRPELFSKALSRIFFVIWLGILCVSAFERYQKYNGDRFICYQYFDSRK